MKRKTSVGMWILVCISLLPLLPWYFLGPVRNLPFNYENLTHSLGQMAALVGMTMFAITFILSTRLRFIEKFLGGLDKVYSVHTILGSAALVLLLFHPILLVLKFIPSNMDLAALYLLPGHGFSVDMGIIALSGLIVLLCVTFYMNIRYNYWKISHKFLGLFFIFAVLHIFLVRGTASRDYIFRGYYIYAVIVSSIGILAFLYSLLFKSTRSGVYSVRSVQKKGSIFDIALKPLKRPLDHKAGEFAFYRFHNRKLGREFHPFSIASPTGSRDIRVVAKDLGDYTGRLDSLKVNDKVTVEGPYGGFTVKGKPANMLWIAGGIGITPFIGMAEDLAKDRAGSNRAVLYYCTRTESELFAMDELKRFEKMSGGRFRVIPWCSGSRGRISLKEMDIEDSMAGIYVCGPKPFKESLVRQLSDHGIDKERIYEEEFLFK